MICLKRNNVCQEIHCNHLEQVTGAKFLSGIAFEHFSIMKNILSLHEKWHKKKAFCKDQLWLGSYFQKEIFSAYLPKISIRWVNETMGWGVFAEQNFQEMEFIAEYSGILRKRKWGDKKNSYCFEYNVLRQDCSPYLIDAQDVGGISRYINHSFNPNLTPALATVGNMTHVVLFTAKPILKGTQLCYDYGEDYWKSRPKPCLIY